MKPINQIFGRLIAGCVLALTLITSVYGQLPPFPDPPTGGNSNYDPAAAWAALLAQFETNRLELLPLMHEGIQLPDGTTGSFAEFVEAGASNSLASVEATAE